METHITTQQQRLENAQKRVKTMKGFYIHALVFVLVNLFIIFSNAFIEGEGFKTMDNYYTAFFWGFGLLAHGLSVFGGELFFGRNWEERKIQEILNQK
ncbi:MAG: 2TM domain-containing protein [Cloacibacterium sp.]|nr:2TM domain-containing protein [Cloacibacterium sp.]